MNTIKISRDEAYRISEMCAKKEPKTLYEDNFIFNDFSLQIGDTLKLRVISEKGNRDFEISGNIANANTPDMKIDYAVVMKDLKRAGKFFPNNNAERAYLATHKDEIKETVQIMAEWAFMIIYYIMNYPRNRKEPRVASHKYSREYRLSTKQNRIYLFSDILKYVSDTYVPEGTHHNIQCPCWEVRGHYRHYKSGKVVFIPAYRKGKHKDTAEPKPHEYYV